ncbi:kinase-like protein [Auricularia subglabra TFB-10046 SS5]|nr:kinase-like protein [Auricularia subglabra TFB-10046 SS5]
MGATLSIFHTYSPISTAYGGDGPASSIRTSNRRSKTDSSTTNPQAWSTSKRTRETPVVVDIAQILYLQHDLYVGYGHLEPHSVLSEMGKISLILVCLLFFFEIFLSGKPWQWSYDQGLRAHTRFDLQDVYLDLSLGPLSCNQSEFTWNAFLAVIDRMRGNADSKQRTGRTGVDVSSFDNINDQPLRDGHAAPNQTGPHEIPSAYNSDVGSRKHLKLQGHSHGEAFDIYLHAEGKMYGGTAVVMKAHATISGRLEILAVKIPFSDNIEGIRKEERNWSRLHHRNILKLICVCNLEDGLVPQGRIAMISQYMELGNLDDYLKRYPRAERLSMMIDVADGLRYLHKEAGMAHGDVKPPNILISRDGSAVIGDFGLSTTISPGPDLTGELHRRLCSLGYCAPELADDQAMYPDAPDIRRSKTTMSDIYAFGMVIYQVYGGERPETLGASVRLIGNIERGEYPARPMAPFPACCDTIWNICTQSWANDPLERPSASEILTQLNAVHRTELHHLLELPINPPNS